MRPRRVAVALALAGGVLLAQPASAHAPHRHRPPDVVIPHIVARASLCDGVLEVNYDPEAVIIRGRAADLTQLGDQGEHAFKGTTDARAAWVHLQDNGSARVELHHVSGAAGDGGRWDPVPADAVWHAVGKEIKVRVGGEPAYDLVRVTLDAPGFGRVASAGVLVTGWCKP